MKSFNPKPQLCLSIYNLLFPSSINVPRINPFVPSAPFLYPLKTSETVRFSDVFRGQRKGALGTNGLIIRLNSLNKKY